MKSRYISITIICTVLVLLMLRLCMVDVVRVPEGKCHRSGGMALVSRWSYGYRLPWDANSRLSYDRAVKDDWMAYNQPASTRNEKANSTPVFIGRCEATPGDTLWYNNESGEVSTSRHGKFTHQLIIPQKGRTIRITNDNIRFYAVTIMIHEPVKASIVDGELCVSGKMVKQYTFTQDYYWLLNDQPSNMADSRAFGFVPQAALIGRIL